jgi:hypothetical protein
VLNQERVGGNLVLRRKRNNKGQVIFYAFMLGITILVLALALAGPIKDQIDSARSPDTASHIGLDCGNSSISVFDKTTCYVSDLTNFYFVGGLIFIAGAVITAKIIFT